MSGTLANARQEMYAKHRARGMVPQKAALAAGFAAGSSTTHLESDAEIVARIAELMSEQEAQRAAQRAAAISAAQVVGTMTGVGRSWVITKLAENVQLAADQGDFKESNRALELIGKEFGMFDGGTDGDDGKNKDNTFDIDKLNAALNQAEGALAPVDNKLALERMVSEDIVMGMIEGHKKPKLAADRVLQTGSETDAGLLFDPNEDGDYNEADFDEPDPEDEE